MKKKHYVDNNKLLNSLIEYRAQIKEAQENNLPKPKVPEYVGECILLISEHLAFKPNFINYSFREEMIGDAVENCLMYIDNFDPEKSQNPFAYLTQIIYYAFLRRIEKEGKQSYIKCKLLEKMEIVGLDRQDHDNKEYTNNYIGYMQDNISDIIKNFEQKENIKRKKINKKKELNLGVIFD